MNSFLVESSTLYAFTADLHAATLTYLTIHTNQEFVAVGFSLRPFYPLGCITSLAENILFRHLTALRSLDLGTNQYAWMLSSHIISISVPLTSLRIVLTTVRDLYHLMSTLPLSETLEQLHVKLSRCNGNLRSILPTPDQLARMDRLHTFTFAKSFSWKLDTEWTLVEILTSTNEMPILRRVNLAIVLTITDLDRIRQSSIFSDSRRVDVHFGLCIHGSYQFIKMRDCIPCGSDSHPKQVMFSMFTTQQWHGMSYYISPDLNYYNRPESCQSLWYTVPWSFDEYFQLKLQTGPITPREVCVSPSLVSTTGSPSIVRLNGSGKILQLSDLSLVPAIVLDHTSQTGFQHHNVITRVKIPIHYVIVLENLCQLNNCIFTLNVRSIHLSLHSPKFISFNCHLLHSLSMLPLLKSLRITVYNAETILNDKDCQIFVEILSMLRNFTFCFRRNSIPLCDIIDENDICYKSIVKLRHYIFNFSFDQQPYVLIEPDGWGLVAWL